MARVPLTVAAAGAALAAMAAAACSQPASPTPATKAGDVVVFGDWHADAPGVRHHITLADLPPPMVHVGVGQAKVVAPPAGALPKVPAGFKVSLFASGLESPKAMHVAPNGDVFVAVSGGLRVLRIADGADKPAQSETFVSGLDQPFGVAFYPLGPNPQWIYVAEINRVVRYPYANGDLKARGPAQVIVPRLAPGGHNTRDLAVSADGTRLYVSVGSSGNLADGMSRKSPDEVKAWEAQHGLGAAWDDDAGRADVLSFDPDGKDLRPYATGIRNCSGLTRQPANGKLWCSVNERDMTGDDLVPDYVTSLKEGGFYGWPWYYMGDHEDPRLAGQRPDLKGKVTVPDVMLQAHSAAVQVAFYDAASGSEVFPAEYRGSAFVALHGSWNRSSRTGYKVVRVPIVGGAATGEYIDFMTGFVLNASDVWARPYGLAVTHDGALLVGDDANGQIFRVTPAK
jgi:glucose/arabinose dehydrogenase